jgi:hypothetical protein
MAYELGKTYFYQHKSVVLKSIWMEENGKLYGAVSWAAVFGNPTAHNVVELSKLQSVQRLKKRVSLTLKLLENNELQVEFANYLVPEAEKDLYCQTTIEVEVENHAQL